jgi:hypothetical protein
VDLFLSILKQAVGMMMLTAVNLEKKFAEHWWKSLQK